MGTSDDANNNLRRGRRRGSSHLALLVLSALLPACGGATNEAPDGGPPPLPTTIAVDELCDVIRQDICTAIVDCRADSGWDYADTTHCMSDVQCDGMTILENAVTSGEVIYDEVAAAECHAAFAANPCGFAAFFFFGVPRVDEILSLCPGPMLERWGTAMAGEPCSTYLSCDADSYCDFDGTCPGTCVGFQGMGDACDPDMDIDCNPFLALDCVGGFCVQQAQTWLPCTDDSDCPGAYCSQLEGLPYPVCDAGGDVGADCGGFDDPECQFGLTCDDDVAGQCRTLPGPGGPCLDNWDCPGDQHCDRPGSGDGTCTDPVGVGETCNFGEMCAAPLRCDAGTCSATLVLAGGSCGTERDCDSGLVCDGDCGGFCTGECVVPAYLGEACNGGQVCLESICDGGVCIPRKDDGESCTLHSDCRSRDCVTMVCAPATTCF